MGIQKVLSIARSAGDPAHLQGRRALQLAPAAVFAGPGAAGGRGARRGSGGEKSAKYTLTGEIS